MITFMILTTFIIHVVATYGIFLAAYMGADHTTVMLAAIIYLFVIMFYRFAIVLVCLWEGW